MGITSYTFNYVTKYLDGVESMCELGNQEFFISERMYQPAKFYFEAMGIRHVSIDLNGKSGALPLDLQEPLDLGQFDMVTDFGTSEHVLDIYACWKNKHNLCKPSGLIISQNPKVGSWPGHGLYYFTLKFYKELARLMGYQIMELQVDDTENGHHLIFCILKKLRDTEFISRAEFVNLNLEFVNNKQSISNQGLMVNTVDTDITTIEEKDE